MKAKDKFIIDKIVNYLYISLILFVCIDIFIGMFEFFLFLFRNLRLRVLFAYLPSDKLVILEHISSAIVTVDNNTFSTRIELYRYKIAATLFILFILYGICVCIFFLNLGIVYVVKIVQKILDELLKPLNKIIRSLKKVGIKSKGIQKKIPYNCIPIPVYARSFYYMFMDTPKECGFKKKDKHKKKIKNEKNIFQKILDTINSTLMIHIFSIFLILFIALFIYFLINFIDKSKE